MHHRLALLGWALAACAPEPVVPPDAAELDATGSTEGGSGETGASADPCAAMNVTFSECSEGAVRAYVWQGEFCSEVLGCCEGPDCDLVFPASWALGGDVGRVDCEWEYVTRGCMPDPCDTCAPDEVCAQWFDGTCSNGGVVCQPAPQGCTPEDVASCGECAERFCEPRATRCAAPGCLVQWPSAVGCYGI